MMLKTHLAFSVVIMFLFLSKISNKFLFIFIILAATIIPDVDTGFSTAGRHIFLKPLQFFVRHRGILHSFTFCILASLAFAYFIPGISLAFFLGYGFHLFLDSFTSEGIMPFWPWRKVSKWHFRTGGRVETSLFVIFLVLDLLALVFFVMSF